MLAVALAFVAYNRHLLDTPDAFSSSEEELTFSSDYVMILDAGSSGTRVHVFKGGASSYSAPYEIYHRKTSLGVSSFFENGRLNREGLFASLSTLFEHTMRHSGIPVQHMQTTPVYLKATAGMRLLSRKGRDEVLRAAEEMVRDRTPFLFRDARVISGTEEAIYDWIAVNLAVRSLPVTSTSTAFVAAMDLGGASAQIAYPTATTSADDVVRLYLPISSSKDHAESLELSLYAVSRLGYGMYEAHHRVLQIAEKDVTSERSEEPIRFPCDIAGGEPRRNKEMTRDVLGTGDFDACVALIRRFFRSASTKHLAATSISSIRAMYGIDNFPKMLSILSAWKRRDDKKPTDETSLAQIDPSFTFDPRTSIESYADAGRDLCRSSWRIVSGLVNYWVRRLLRLLLVPFFVGSALTTNIVRPCVYRERPARKRNCDTAALVWPTY